MAAEADAQGTLAELDTTVTTSDGLKLRLQRWPAIVPAGAAVHGTVQIVHGLGEHIGRYAELAASLNRRGWNVAGHDLRGHGRSQGPRGGIKDAASHLDDLSRVIDGLRSGPRHVLLGHSMGGLIAARFVAEGLEPRPASWARELDGLVLSSPALDAGLSVAQRLLLAVLGTLAPGLRLGNGLNPDWISRDPEVVRRYVDDPLVHPQVTPRVVRFIVDAGRQVLHAAPRWRLPTLLLWAGADRCVRPRGSADFAAAAPPAAVRSQVFPELAHEIFNEPEKAEVVEHLTRWLRRFQVCTTDDRICP
jgi:alpha-beta hydrolase superfamily lysophospholipase